MNNSSAPSANPISSLISWMVLSGVHTEVGEISAYEALQKRQSERQSSVEVTDEKPKVAENIKKPLQQKIALPEFNSLEQLSNFCSEWKEFNLAKTSSRCVVGQGSEAPLLYIISDMPEDEEDRTGEAFTSPANQIIKKALSFTDIPGDKIYFSYLSKWRTPGRRSLAPMEMDVCRQLMDQEIRLLAPQFVLTLGETTREFVVNSDNINQFGKLAFGKMYKKQIFNKEVTILASQKGELLVKNPAMKKNFWFGLLELASQIRANGDPR